MEAIGKLTRLTLGRIGEYDSRTIQIDVSEWEEMFPGCAIGVLVFPPADDHFPQTNTCHIAATEKVDGVLTWTIHAADVAEYGEGFVEIRAIGYEENNGITVTSVRITRAIPTITYNSTAEIVEEEPMQQWLNLALSYQQNAQVYASNANMYADLAEAMANAAEQHETNAGGYATTAGQLAMLAAEQAEKAGQYASLALLEGGMIAFKLEDGHMILYYTDNITPLVEGMEHFGT